MARTETSLMLDQLTSALKNCNQAIKLAPDVAHAYFIRALVKLRSNKVISAIDDAQIALLTYLK